MMRQSRLLFAVLALSTYFLCAKVQAQWGESIFINDYRELLLPGSDIQLDKSAKGQFSLKIPGSGLSFPLNEDLSLQSSMMLGATCAAFKLDCPKILGAVLDPWSDSKQKRTVIDPKADYIVKVVKPVNNGQWTVSHIYPFHPQQELGFYRYPPPPDMKMVLTKQAEPILKNLPKDAAGLVGALKTVTAKNLEKFKAGADDASPKLDEEAVVSPYLDLFYFRDFPSSERAEKSPPIVHFQEAIRLPVKQRVIVPIDDRDEFSSLDSYPNIFEGKLEGVKLRATERGVPWWNPLWEKIGINSGDWLLSINEQEMSITSYADLKKPSEMIRDLYLKGKPIELKLFRHGEVLVIQTQPKPGNYKEREVVRVHPPKNLAPAPLPAN